MKHQVRIFTLCAALLASSQCLQAQNEITVYDGEDDQEEAFILPEGMQSDELDSLLREWNVKNSLQFDENCETSTENPTFSEEVYKDRLSRLPNVMEMSYNPVVAKFIDQYSGKLRRSVSVMLGASNFYNPIFEEALESYQVPLELKYLPVIESALNPGATSHAGAAGLWQFMIGTGKKYGLEVTSLIDERRDPIKASYAAAHYLKDLYDIFGDWTLVIAAYNCGPGNVTKAIKRAGGVKDYWQIYPYLPNETRGYVPAFIAANYIMNYYCEHNICPVNTRLPASTDTLCISQDIHMDQIVAMCDIPMEQLRSLNPQYRTSLIPGNSHGCTLRMPSENISKFLEAGDSIYNYRASELLTRRTETVVPEGAVTPATTRSRKGRSGGTRSVTVRSGENLSVIARRNGTTVAQLKKLNGLRGNTIQAGKKLRVR